MHDAYPCPVSEPLPADWTAWRRHTDLDAYERRWQRLAEAGVDPHGEVALVQTYAPRSVLDAGCGTGRVAVELAHRGIAAVGVDNDADMIAAARAKSPDQRWIVADLADLALPDRFDVVVLAGNVVPYIAADRRAAAVEACARHLAARRRARRGLRAASGMAGPRRGRRVVQVRRAHARRPLGHLGPAALHRRRLRRVRTHDSTGTRHRDRSAGEARGVAQALDVAQR